VLRPIYAGRSRRRSSCGDDSAHRNLFRGRATIASESWLDRDYSGGIGIHVDERRAGAIRENSGVIGTAPLDVAARQ
jgi:hypothetical protein